MKKYIPFLSIVFSLVCFSCAEHSNKKDEALLWKCINRDLQNYREDSVLMSFVKELSENSADEAYKEFGKGWLLLFKKDSTGAEKIFHSMASNKHKAWLGYSGLGLLQWTNEHYAISKKYYDSALVKNQHRPEIYYLRGLCLMKLDTTGTNNEAVKDFDKASEIRKDFYYSYYMAGVAKYHADQTSLGLKKSIPYMEKAIAIDSMNPAAYVFLGEKYDTYYKRIFYLKKAIAAHDTASYSRMAFLKMEFGDYQDALDYFTLYLKFDASDPEIFVAKARCLMTMGRYDEALETLTHARALDPSEAYSHINYRKSLLHYDKYDYQNALKEINIVIEEDTLLQPEYFVHKARILMALNKKAEAKKVLREYLQGIKEDDEVDPEVAQNMMDFYWNE